MGRAPVKLGSRKESSFSSGHKVPPHQAWSLGRWMRGCSIVCRAGSWTRSGSRGPVPAACVFQLSDQAHWLWYSRDGAKWPRAVSESQPPTSTAPRDGGHPLDLQLGLWRPAESTGGRTAPRTPLLLWLLHQKFCQLCDWMRTER